ncbi:MAG: hypothetical protein LBV13_05670 [Methanomassiliicoccaceae archaeon]|jgi:hypothetical protein|nr:hypothetical protein [Methanomassiliicoccaceae archaeon]
MHLIEKVNVPLPFKTARRITHGGKFSWNPAGRLDIAAGLAAGVYTVVITATNSEGVDTITFILTVTETPSGGSGPDGDNTMMYVAIAIVIIAAIGFTVYWLFIRRR